MPQQIVDIPGVGQVEFPDSMTPDAVNKAAKKLWSEANLKPVLDRQAAKYPSAQEQAPDTRSAGQVAKDQAWNVGKGAAGLIPGMLQTGWDVVSGAAKIPLQGAMRDGQWTPAAQQIQDAAAGLLGGVAAPLKGLATSAQGAGAYIAPGSIQAPSREAWEEGAQTGGAMAAGAALPKIGQGAKGLAKRGMNATAQDWYRRSLKPSSAAPMAEQQRVVETGLREGIPTNEAGWEKAQSTVADLNTQIQGAIDKGAGAGETISPAKVANTADASVPSHYENQILPDTDMAIMKSMRDRFMDRNSTTATPGPAPYGTPSREIPIPIDAAQKAKVSTYKTLGDKAYSGEALKPAEVAYEKSLARGYAEQIADQVPELKDLNARESLIFELEPYLQRAIGRTGNAQLVGVGGPLATGVGNIFGGKIGAATAGGLRAILDNPAIRSKLAISLAKHMPQSSTLGKSTAAALRLNALTANKEAGDR